jgi:hypothetical protein
VRRFVDIAIKFPKQVKPIQRTLCKFIQFAWLLLDLIWFVFHDYAVTMFSSSSCLHSHTYLQTSKAFCIRLQSHVTSLLGVG